MMKRLGSSLATALLVVAPASADLFSPSWGAQMTEWRKRPAKEMAAQYDLLLRTKGERPEWLAGYATNVGTWHAVAGSHSSPAPPESTKQLALARARRAAALAPKRAYPLLAELRIWASYASPDLSPYLEHPPAPKWITVQAREPGGEWKPRRIPMYEIKGHPTGMDPDSRAKVLDLLHRAESLEPNDGWVLALRAQFDEKDPKKRLLLDGRASDAMPGLLLSLSFLEGAAHDADAAGNASAAAVWRRQIQTVIRAYPDEYATKRFLARTRGKV